LKPKAEGELLFKKVVKALLESIILKASIEQGGIAPYPLMGWIEEFYGIRFSPGTIYTTLKDLEIKGLLKSNDLTGKRSYKITKLGRNHYRNVSAAKAKITALIEKTFC